MFIWVIIGAFLGGVVPSASAGELETLHTLGQVVNTDGVQDQSVGDLVETYKKWELVTLSVSMVLVLALLFAGGLLKPGGYAKVGLRDVDSLPVMVWLFAIFVVFLAQGSAPTVVDKIQWIKDQEFNETQLHAINSVAYFGFGIIAGIGMLFILKRSATTEGENKSGLGLGFLDFPVGLGCFMLAFPFIQLMNILGTTLYRQTQDAEPENMAHPTLEMLHNQPENPWVWAIVACAIIGAPIVEELVFRVFLQGALIKAVKSPWLSIVVASLAFAGIHRLSSTPLPWHALVPIFAVGMSCGVAYERTKRVGVPIMMHMCFNAYMVALTLTIHPDAAQSGV